MRFEQAVDAVKQRAAQDGGLPPEQLAVRFLHACLEETHCTGAGISLMTKGGSRAVLAASDEVAIRLEEIQFNFGEGPCTTTMETRSPVLQPDLALLTHEWSLYTAAAQALGVKAVFAFPLRAGNTHLGALELYRTEAGSMSSEDYFHALVYAEAALSLMVDTSDAGDSWELHPSLSRALEVYHAVGMVAMQAGVSPEDALSLLRGHAFAQFQTLMEASLDVVEGTVVIGPNHETP